LIQSRCEPTLRARIIAANNILSALFMIVSALLGYGLLSAGFSIPQLFLVTGIMNAAVALYIYRLVPEFLMRFLAWLLIHSIYRVHKKGVEHIPEEGGCIVVCNHVSFVDAVVIAAAVRRPIRFIMDHRIFAMPLLNFIFRTMRTIPIAPAREDEAMKERAFAEAAAALAAGEVIGIFPEGRLTDTGDINVFRPGVQRILDRVPVPVVPMALSGLWGSVFSRAPKATPLAALRGLFSRIALTVGRPIPPQSASLQTLQMEVAQLRGDAR